MGARARASGALSPGERELLEGLVRDMGPRLLAYVRRVYVNERDAEDIVAETFYRAATNIKSLRASERQDLYLLTIARNLCRDGFRRQRPMVPLADRALHTTERGSQPQDSLIEDEQAQRLRDAVGRLPESLREVVVLRLSGELKFEEIARLLKIPLGTALSRMHAAVRRLRETMGVQA